MGKRVCLIFLLSFIFSFFIGCSNKEKRKQPGIVINNIKVVLENSASMKGYMEGNTEFKDIISNLSIKLENISSLDTTKLKIKNTSYQFLDEDRVQNEFADPQDFRNYILSNQVMTGKSSLLDKIIKNEVDNLDTSSITILVTDLILSYSDKEIRRQPFINISNISGLQGNIAGAFSNANKKGLGVILLQFDSDFNGVYFDYSNGKHLLNNHKRPFYFLIIGGRNLLKTFLDNLIEQGLQFQNSSYFGLNPNNLNYAILNYTPTIHNWRLDQSRKKIEQISLGKNEDLNFVIGADLNILPSNIKNNLEEYIKVEENSVKVKSIKYFKKEDFNKISKKEYKDFSILKKLTHFIELRTSDLYENKASLVLSIQNDIPDWIKSDNILDDTKVENNSRKTFGLENFYKGILEGYNNSKTILNFTINLEKN